EEIKELLGVKFDIFLNIFQDNSSNKYKQVINANKENKKIKIKSNLAKDFKELWDSINKKASIVYKNIKEKELIETIVKEFNALKIEKEILYYEKKVFNAQENIIITQEFNVLKEIDYKASLYNDIHNLFLNFC
ncbi:DEAD/DEAH box helicase, partial [Campylobacter volucris]|nr:DEAD/DEAH box helicase [Campylobacter volucris]